VTGCGELTRYALACAARGWHVFPLTPGDKVPPRDWPWKQRNTTRPDLIRRLWAGSRANIGLACGPSGLVVIDLDVPKPGQQPPSRWDKPGIRDGSDVLADLCEQHGEPWPGGTFTVRTRRCGTHLYFTAPPCARLGNTAGDRGQGLGWCIDTRGRGGYVVGPGSHVNLPDGSGTYEVVDPAPAAPLPAWLARLLTAPADSSEQADAVLAEVTGSRRGAGYAHAALLGEVQNVLDAAEGARNDTLNRAAFALGQLAALIPGDLARDALLTAARQAGLPAREADATIRSGLQAGAGKPRSAA